jgi:hypothetical protein
MTISPEIPVRHRKERALSMQMPSVSASSRHGITIESSIAPAVAKLFSTSFRAACTGFLSGESESISTPPR